MEVFTTASALASGITPAELAASLKRGELLHLARGIYARPDANPLQDSPEVRHLAMAAACPDDVLALESAALVHGLPLRGWPPPLVQVVHPGNGRSRRRGIRQVMSAPLPDEHISTLPIVPLEGGSALGQTRLTSRARTVVDLARMRGLEPGLIAWEKARWDARVANNLTAFDASARWAVDLLRGRHGIERARQALDLASAYSQSPMETRSLMAIRRLPIPPPVQQYVVRNSFGAILGEADFAWPELGVLGEYDGKDKYTRLARPGEDASAVVRREKRRQESMEAEGWVFARWGLEELASLVRLERRIQLAFTIAGGRPRATG